MNTKLIANLLIPLATIRVLLIFYPKISLLVGGMGYGFGKGSLADIQLEVLFVIISYCTIFFVLKDNCARYVLAPLPVLLLYVFYDYYFVSFGKVFKFCDMSELPELIDVLPLWQTAGYSSILLGLIALLVINAVRLWQRFVLPLFIVSTITLIIAFAPTLYINLFKTVAKFGVIEWSDEYTAQNGYITSVLYFEAMMSKAKQDANLAYTDDEDYAVNQEKVMQFVAEKGNGHNVHVIVLESFFNPQSFRKISYNAPTYHEKFSKMVRQHESVVISPVFGGFKAQAEFEVLCGVPALHKYGSIEFNSFTGNKTFCLPALLKNYRTVATNSYKPNFFNTPNADKGIGFAEIYFPRQYANKSETYLDLVDNEKFMFDGDLFAQNLQFVKQHIAEDNHKPLFNYVLGVYGHMPFTMNENRHPLLLKAQMRNKALDDEYHRAINQIFYRTLALANYLTELIKLDPQSLIIVMGDHVPRLGGTTFYQKTGYRNNSNDSIHKPPVFYIVNGQFVKKIELHQYDIMNVVFNYLTNNSYCQVYSCQRSKNRLAYQYNQVMANALK